MASRAVKFIKDLHNDEEWAEAMENPGLLIVDVHPDWCGGSYAINSTFKKIFFSLTETKKLLFFSASNDDITVLQKFRGRSHSTFLLIKDGVLGASVVGNKAPELTKLINSMAPNLADYQPDDKLTSVPLADPSRPIEPPAELVMNSMKRAPSSRGLISSQSLVNIKDILDNVDKEKDEKIPDQVEAKEVTLKIKDIESDTGITMQVKTEIGKNYGELHKIFVDYANRKANDNAPVPLSRTSSQHSTPGTGIETSPQQGESLARTSSTTSIDSGSNQGDAASPGPAGGANKNKIHTMTWENFTLMMTDYAIEITGEIRNVFSECDWERKLDLATGGEDHGYSRDDEDNPINRLLFEEYLESIVRVAHIWESESSVLSEQVGSFIDFLEAGPAPKPSATEDRPESAADGAEGREGDEENEVPKEEEKAATPEPEPVKKPAGKRPVSAKKKAGTGGAKTGGRTTGARR